MKRLLVTTSLGLGLALYGSSVAGQTISDRISDATRAPGTPVVVGTLAELLPLSVEQLTNLSDLILEARVSHLTTRIDETDTAVVTEFALLPLRVLAGSLPAASPTAGVATPLVLTSYGGEVVRKGVVVRAQDHSLRPIRDNRVYLLFLAKSVNQVPGRYRMYDGAAFELLDDRAQPLAIEGAHLFKDFSNPYSQVLARIMSAASAR